MRQESGQVRHQAGLEFGKTIELSKLANTVLHSVVKTDEVEAATTFAAAPGAEMLPCARAGGVTGAPRSPSSHARSARPSSGASATFQPNAQNQQRKEVVEKTVALTSLLKLYDTEEQIFETAPAAAE